MQQSIGPLGQINQTLCQEEGHPDSHFQKEGFQQDHREAVEDFQAVEVCLEEFPMWDPWEEETPDEGQTNWWEIVKKQPSQDILQEDAAAKELSLTRLVSSYTLPRQNSQPGKRGRQTAHSKVLSRRTRDM